MAYTPLTTQVAGGIASAAGWANLVDANFDSMGPHLLVLKAADETISNTTIQSDDHLITPSIAANEVWWLEWRLRIISVAGAYRAQFVIPSGSIAGSSNGTTGDRLVSTTSGGANIDSNNAADGFAHIIRAQFANGGTPGVVTLQWCSSGASSTTVKANSTLWGVKLA